MKANGDGTCIVSDYTGSVEELIRGMRVTGIDDRVFIDCRSMTSVSIPQSVTSIGADAFALCDSLQEICGVPGSAAETLATENGWCFVSME